MDFSAIKALDEKYVLQTYGRNQVAIDHGKGATLWDPQGKEYIVVKHATLGIIPPEITPSPIREEISESRTREIKVDSSVLSRKRPLEPRRRAGGGAVRPGWRDGPSCPTAGRRRGLRIGGGYHQGKSQGNSGRYPQ